MLGRVLSGFFVALFLFELANYVGILHFQVDYTWFGRLVSTGTVFGVLLALDFFFSKKLNSFLPARVWLCGALLIIGDFSGDFFGLYKGWDQYDQLVHFLGGPILVGAFIAIFEALSRIQAWRHPGYVTYLLALGTSAIWAVLYEAEEYIEDLIFHSNRLGDGPDTANDLLMNLVGGAVFIGVTVLYRRYAARSRSIFKPVTFRFHPTGF